MLEKYPTLSYALDNSRFKNIDTHINTDINNGFPGAGLIIVKDNNIIKQTVYGYSRKYDNKGLLKHTFDTMQMDTMFDLASNTKMYATVYTIMHLLSLGKIDLMLTIDNYIPEFKNNTFIPKVINLLCHDAGYPPDIDIYKYGATHKYPQIRDIIATIKPERPIGGSPIYSDIDFILLGIVIEAIVGEPLDAYVETNIYKPLGLNHTVYNPLLKGFNRLDFAATEVNGNTRGGTVKFADIRTTPICGEVHDEKTYYGLGGIAGHAGLFSNLHDMAILTQIMLNNGGYGNHQFWRPEIQKLFTTPNQLDSSFGLGWRHFGHKTQWLTKYSSNQAVGHSGWTGTVTVIDPAYNLAIILLTNKKHSEYIDGTFVGDGFATGKYATIIELIYISLLSANHLHQIHLYSD